MTYAPDATILKSIGNDVSKLRFYEIFDTGALTEITNGKIKV